MLTCIVNIQQVYNGLNEQTVLGGTFKVFGNTTLFFEQAKTSPETFSLSFDELGQDRKPNN